MSNMNDSEIDFLQLSSEELCSTADCENASCAKSSLGEFIDGESEENENGKKSSKSPAKIYRISTVLEETEEELKHRQKYPQSKEEVVKNRLLRCTVCSCSLQATLLNGHSICHHPVLKVLICKQCVNFYGSGNFSLDEDGSDKYCRWCGQGGMLYCCSLCCSAFCKSCIKRNFGRSLLVDIEKEDWRCLVCNVKPLWDLRALCANAEVYSKEFKRNKQLESMNKPKWMPLKDKPRPSRHKMKHSTHAISSSEESLSGIEQAVEEGGSISVRTMGNEKGSGSNSMQDHSSGGGNKLPEEVDEDCAKLASQLFDRCCRDLVDVGEVLVLRAQRCVEKKVNLRTMKNPKNVDKVVKSLQSLMTLAQENLQQVNGFLSLSHSHWAQVVVKRSSTKIDSDGIKEIRVEKSNKRKFKKEKSDSDASEVVSSGENGGHSRKSVMGDKKRRKLKDELEMEIDEIVDSDSISTVTDTGNSENCKRGSESLMKGSSNQTVRELRVELGEGTVKGISSVSAKYGEDSEVRNGNEDERLSVGSEEVEAGNVAERIVEHRGLLNETALLETDRNSESTLWSQAGSESLYTLQLGDAKTPQRGRGSDILFDAEKSTVHDEETLHKKMPKMSGVGQRYETLNNAESEGKHTHSVSDGDLASKDKDTENFDSGNVVVRGGGGKNGDSDDLAATDKDSKNGTSGDVTERGKGAKNGDIGDLAVTDKDSKNGTNGDVTEWGEGAKNGDIGDQAATDKDSKNGTSGDVAVRGKGTKNGDISDLAETDGDSKNGNSDDVAVKDDIKNDASGDVAVFGNDIQNADIDALSAVEVGNESIGSDALTVIAVGINSDTLTALSGDNKTDDNDALTAVGESSKCDDTDTLASVNGGNKIDDSDTLTVVGESNKCNDTDTLASVNGGNKIDDSDALTVVGESNKNVEDSNNNNSDADTIEFLFDDENEKNLSDVLDDYDDNEQLTSADNLKSIKEHLDKNETDGDVKIDKNKLVSLEVPDSVKEDTVVADRPYITVRDMKELLMAKYVTEYDKNNCEEHTFNTCKDLDKDSVEKDDVEKRLESYDKQRSSDMGKLKLSDNMPTCKHEEKDGEEDAVDVDEDKDNIPCEAEMGEGTTGALKFTAECLKAQQSILAYTTDSEDTSADMPPKKSKKKTQSQKTKQEVASLKVTKPSKMRHVNPKSQLCEGSGTTSSSLSSTDTDSDCSIGRKFTKQKEGRKKKFRLRDIAAYKQDQKLQWKCTVPVARLPDEVFQEHYQRYCTDSEDDAEKKDKSKNEIHSLVNLNTLKKRRANKHDTNDSDTDGSIDVGKKKPKITKKDRNKEEEQKLINFFNQKDDDGDASISAGASDTEEEAMKALKSRKSLLEKESEMIMKALLAISTDGTDSDSSEQLENPVEDKKVKVKPKEKTDEAQSVTEKEKEIKIEEKADSCPGDGDVSSGDSEALKRKSKWRRDRLLTAKLSDLDTSDEERRWKTKKEKEQKKDNDDSEEKSTCEVKTRKKKIKRRILGSDEDSVNILSSSEDNSSDDFIFKRKKSTKKSNSGRDSSADTDKGQKKVKRKRIKALADDSSSSEGGQVDCSQKSDTPGKGRKNIHRIMKDADVREATRKAAREEEERRKRISEKQKLYNTIYDEAEGVEVFDRLVLDFDPETKKELVALDPYIVSKLKPHQVKGVKFMWDACFESLKQIAKTKGSGCILAHCMGLGKTLQVVALVHTLLNHKDTKVHTVLVVCPLSTVLNWVNEFNMWLKDIGNGEEVTVFELSKYKKNYERMYQLQEWQNCGGVMVMGYDMFRILTNPKAVRMRKKAIETFQSILIDPGPDVIVCDEGHMLKNEDTALSKAMNRIRTLRRIVLTGTPLQNNLKEYHCMVQFVKPNLLGNRREFQNRFMNPISNGQFEDSTAHDVKIMKRRAHVLHKMLEGSVQRFDYSVLTPFLPPKHEYVISIRLSQVQIKAYQYYLENCAMGKSGVHNKGAQLFSDYQNLSRIWTHPRVLQMSTETAEKNAEKRRLMESDSEGSLRDFIDDGDTDDTETSSSSSSSDESDVQVIAKGGDNKTKSTSRSTRNTRSKAIVEEPEVEVQEEEKSKPATWWQQFIEGDELENMKHGGKLVLLFSILRECEKIGDKVLVFSQSLYSLNLIEYFLACVDTATQASESKESLDNHIGSWSPGLDYFRLDGSTSAENRNIWCKAFNREDNHRARLFIISTRAGGLGINLFAANRVIVFDASWNPSHDVQSIFRVYRFGQKKPCYIYRFLAQGTMEEKIYDRQVTKLSLSCRVVDEQQIERHYNMADLQELYKFSPEEKTKHSTPILPKDRLLAELLKEHEQWIVTYHEHDSLLQNKEEEELNEEERKAAWEDYENEKQGKTLPTPGLALNAGRLLNLPGLRDTLRKENPHLTEEELDLRLKLVMGQIYDYMLSSKNGMPSVNAQYNAAHAQTVRQFQIQQELLLRAQQQEQQRLQQQNSGWPVPNNFNADMSFRQYLQNQGQPNQNTVIYPTNLYRNVAAERPGVFRTLPKLVPYNPSGSSTRTLVQNKDVNVGGSEVITRVPVSLSQLPTRTVHPPFAHASSRVNHGEEILQQFNPQQSSRIETSVPHDVIETID